MFQQTIFVTTTEIAETAETVETVLKMEPITRADFDSEEEFYRAYLKLPEDEDRVFYEASLYEHCLSDRLRICISYGMSELFESIWTQHANFIAVRPSLRERYPSPLWWEDEAQTERGDLIIGFGDLVDSETDQQEEEEAAEAAEVAEAVETYAELGGQFGTFEEEVEGHVMSVAKRRRV